MHLEIGNIYGTYQFVQYPIEISVKVVETGGRCESIQDDEELPLKLLASLTSSLKSSQNFPEDSNLFHDNLLQIMSVTPARKGIDGKIVFMFKESLLKRSDKQVTLTVEACRLNAIENHMLSGRSIPFKCVRHLLKISEINNEPYVWYKDEGGKDKCIELHVRLVDCNDQLVLNRTVPLDIVLTYASSGETVPDQNILQLSPDSCVTITNGTGVLKLRIIEVSNRHRGQLFQVSIFPKYGTSPSSYSDVGSAVSTPIEVKSKRNSFYKRKLLAEQEAAMAGGGSLAATNEAVAIERHDQLLFDAAWKKRKLGEVIQAPSIPVPVPVIVPAAVSLPALVKRPPLPLTTSGKAGGVVGGGGGGAGGGRASSSSGRRDSAEGGVYGGDAEDARAARVPPTDDASDISSRSKSNLRVASSGDGIGALSDMTPDSGSAVQDWCRRVTSKLNKLRWMQIGEEITLSSSGKECRRPQYEMRNPNSTIDSLLSEYEQLDFEVSAGRAGSAGRSGITTRESAAVFTTPKTPYDVLVRKLIRIVKVQACGSPSHRDDADPMGNVTPYELGAPIFAGNHSQRRDSIRRPNELVGFFKPKANEEVVGSLVSRFNFPANLPSECSLDYMNRRMAIQKIQEFCTSEADRAIAGLTADTLAFLYRFRPATESSSYAAEESWAGTEVFICDNRYSTALLRSGVARSTLALNASSLSTFTSVEYDVGGHNYRIGSIAEIFSELSKHCLEAQSRDLQEEVIGPLQQKLTQSHLNQQQRQQQHQQQKAYHQQQQPSPRLSSALPNQRHQQPLPAAAAVVAPVDSLSAKNSGLPRDESSFAGVTTSAGSDGGGDGDGDGSSGNASARSMHNFLSTVRSFSAMDQRNKHKSNSNGSSSGTGSGSGSGLASGSLPDRLAQLVDRAAERSSLVHGGDSSSSGSSSSADDG